jgi:hypothetical protein
MKEIYEQKGYSKSWIDKRLLGIAVNKYITFMLVVFRKINGLYSGSI